MIRPKSQEVHLGSSGAPSQLPCDVTGCEYKTPLIPGIGIEGLMHYLTLHNQRAHISAPMPNQTPKPKESSSPYFCILIANSNYEKCNYNKSLKWVKEDLKALKKYFESMKFEVAIIEDSEDIYQSVEDLLNSIPPEKKAQWERVILTFGGIKHIFMSMLRKSPVFDKLWILSNTL